MKKNGILNSCISSVLSYMRHTDLICISDAGLPCPSNVIQIDLALKKNLPSFIDVLSEVIKDMKVEKIFLAKEIKQKNDNVHKEILSLMQGVQTEYISHETFKNITSSCKAIIRTGEITPYANIILRSGCLF